MAHVFRARQALERAGARIEHEIDAEGARFDRFAERADGAELGEAPCPAADPGQFVGAAAEGVGQVDEQYGGIGVGGGLAFAHFVEGFGHLRLVDAPFFRRGVVAVQVDPAAGRGFAAGAEVFDDGLAGVVHAALADQRQPVLDRPLARAELRHLGIGACHVLPQGQNLPEVFRLERRRRQGLAA